MKLITRAYRYTQKSRFPGLYTIFFSLLLRHFTKRLMFVDRLKYARTQRNIRFGVDGGCVDVM